MNNLIVVSITCLISGVTVSLWLAVRTEGGIIAFIVLYGFVSGGLVSLPPATVVSLSKSQDEYGTRMGLAFTVSSFGVLVGNPSAGGLLALGGSRPFLGPWLFAGGTMISAAAFTMGAYYFHTKNDGRRGSSASDSSTERLTRSRRLQSLAKEALAMQGAVFAL
jgi:MFS family permease